MQSVHPQHPSGRTGAATCFINPSDGVNYYFVPGSLADLQKALALVAKIPGATLRVSGQRHSQPPLVTDDNRNAVPAKTTEFLVDVSCYCDLGPTRTKASRWDRGQTRSP
jgi:hypothetical protein